MENIHYVYEYVDPITLIPFYIGKGSGNRSTIHLKETYNTTINKKKWAYIEGLRRKGLQPIINILKEGLTNGEAYKLEEELIKKYGRKDKDDGGILTNIHIKARPPIRKGPRKPRAKGKDSPMFGKSCYDIWIEKYGKQKADELELLRREKIRITSKGRKMPEETLLKLKMEGTRSKQVLGKIWISNDILKKNRHIYPEQVKLFSNDLNWYKGKTDYTGNKAKNKKCWINNGEVQRQIIKDEIIPTGWVKGPKPYSKKKSYTKNGLPYGSGKDKVKEFLN